MLSLSRQVSSTVSSSQGKHLVPCLPRSGRAPLENCERSNKSQWGSWVGPQQESRFINLHFHEEQLTAMVKAINPCIEQRLGQRCIDRSRLPEKILWWLGSDG